MRLLVLHLALHGSASGSCSVLGKNRVIITYGIYQIWVKSNIRIIGMAMPLSKHNWWNVSSMWLQARLAVGRGGLGIRGSEDHAGAAFASSFLSSQPLVKELLGRDDDSTPPLPRNLLDSLTAKLGEEDRATVLQGIGGEEASTIWLQGLSQRKMSTMIDEENFCSLRRQIEAEGNAREIARLASLGLS